MEAIQPVIETEHEVDLDRWRSPEYKRLGESRLPRVRWNSKKTSVPPMYILEDSAEAANFVEDSSTWTLGDFTFEPNKETLEITTKTCWFCKEPVISVIKLLSKRIVYRKDQGNFKKGSPVPSNTAYDNSIHVIRPTYLIAILEHLDICKYPYRLLHNVPFLWTPPISAAAIFRSRIYHPLCSHVEEIFGMDLPKHLFAIHLSSVLEKVGEPAIVANVPKASIPTNKDHFLKHYVGDDNATIFAEWYKKYKPENVNEAPESDESHSN